ncbi:MAG: hypothetical protein AABW73_02585 [Nanoarchaeota archaeon]
MSSKDKGVVYFLEYDDTRQDHPLFVLNALSSVSPKGGLREVYVDTVDSKRGLKDIKGVLEKVVPHFYNNKPRVKVYSLDIQDSLYSKASSVPQDSPPSLVIFSRGRSSETKNLLSRLEIDGFQVLDFIKANDPQRIVAKVGKSRVRKAKAVSN